MIKQANPADEAEYVCSVSAFKKTEIRHEVRVRGKMNLIRYGQLLCIAIQSNRSLLPTQGKL